MKNFTGVVPNEESLFLEIIYDLQNVKFFKKNWTGQEKENSWLGVISALCVLRNFNEIKTKLYFKTSKHMQW